MGHLDDPQGRRSLALRLVRGSRRRIENDIFSTHQLGALSSPQFKSDSSVVGRTGRALCWKLSMSTKKPNRRDLTAKDERGTNETVQIVYPRSYVLARGEGCRPCFSFEQERGCILISAPGRFVLIIDDVPHFSEADKARIVAF